MKKKLSFIQIWNPQLLGEHAVSGRIVEDGGRSNGVVVKRRMVGWQIYLVVRINGVTTYNKLADEDDMREFNSLYTRAYSDHAKNEEYLKVHAHALSNQNLFSSSCL